MKNSGPVLFDIPERRGRAYESFEKVSLNASHRVVDIFAKKEATRKDIENWFYKKGGRERISTLLALAPSKQLSKFSNILNAANQQGILPYYLPRDIHNLYQILVGEKVENIENVENILSKIYNFLSKETKVSWYMGVAEFKEWYYSTDELGKTGKDYVIDGIRHNFSIAWKESITELNKRRKIHGKGILNTTRATIMSHVGNSSRLGLSEFLTLLGESPEEIQKILQIEKQAKHEKQACIYHTHQKKIKTQTTSSPVVIENMKGIHALTAGVYNMFQAPVNHTTQQNEIEEQQTLSPKDVQKMQGVHALTTGMYNMFKPLVESDT